MTTTEQLILLAVLVGLMLFVMWFELKWMRGRNKDVRAGLQKKDEAFNSILTTRHVINVVQRGGRDTRSAQALLEEAKYAMQKNDYDRAMDLAEKARNELTHPGSRGPIASGPAEDLEKVAEEVLATPKKDEDLYTGTKLPVDQTGSYLSAKFELSSAKEDLGRAVSMGKDVSVGQSLLNEADTAFEQGNYTKVLSLSVRARKTIGVGGAVETIRLKAQPEEIEEEPPPGTEPPPMDANAKACGQCGEPIEQGDAFCGRCGARAITERTCQNCGAKARPTDRFCRKCGGPVST